MFESTQLDFAEIPSELVAYLSCLGTVIDETGKKARFSVQATMTPLVVQGCNGTFGIVNAISQTHYATILSPFVALQRILADYEFSEHGGERMWDLPQLVRPLDVRYTHPNANMLGWAPAVQFVSSLL